MVPTHMHKTFREQMVTDSCTTTAHVHCARPAACAGFRGPSAEKRLSRPRPEAGDLWEPEATRVPRAAGPPGERTQATHWSLSSATSCAGAARSWMDGRMDGLTGLIGRIGWRGWDFLNICF